MPLYFIKDFHHHSETEIPQSDLKHTNHLHDNCAICQYNLDLYTESKPLVLPFITKLISIEHRVFQIASAHSFSFSHYLRAPPLF